MSVQPLVLKGIGLKVMGGALERLGLGLVVNLAVNKKSLRGTEEYCRCRDISGCIEKFQFSHR